MKKDFVLCGLTGWCLEVLWTGLHALLKGESTMMGQTSLLMFPIYGCAFLIKPAYQRLRSLPAPLRGCLYAAGIYGTEFVSGRFLMRRRMCPWDYSSSPFQYKKVIRLDYAPLWVLTG
ncbi:MAG: hypothetical protein Q4D55_06365, partial [Eubacteriales bacterium]|nr:hypothetical protein [Eubacteriales bacterium]